MSTLIRRKWTRVAFQGGFPALLRRHVSQAAHGAFFVEELDIVRDRGEESSASPMRKPTNISLHSVWTGHLEDSSAIAWYSSRRK